MAAVLVHIELDRPHHVAVASRGALAAGRKIASAWGATLYAAVIVRDAEATADGASVDAPIARLDGPLAGLAEVQRVVGRSGADKLIIGVTDVEVTPRWTAIGTAWLAILNHVEPRLVLFGTDDPAAPELINRSAKHLGAKVMPELWVTSGNAVELRGRDNAVLGVGDFQLVVATTADAAGETAGDGSIDVIRIVAPTPPSRPTPVPPEARR